MKTTLIVIGVIVHILLVIFLYLLIDGADESRRKDRYKDRQDKER